ncbi:MAG: serine/threonine protein kinase [Candidatus Bathyarchaeota archaeon]|nr:serine/threonine protein kinase [Candidatus Bathyarchaeota archaeon]
MRLNELVPLERLHEDRYRQILCYPKYDSKEMKKRLKELKKLGVKAVEFTGAKMAFDMPVLGKGCVGIVVAVHTDAGKCALKIRRVDAGRAGMQHEAEMLRRANAIHVGPRLLNVTDNFLLMEFIEGTLLPQWVEALRGRGTRSRIRRVLRAVLEQCYRLDEAGLDHGELSRAPKHIIVDADDRPHLVDFETASINRRVSNVTSICQYLFIGSQTAKTIKRKLGKVNEKELINALRNYKHERTQENIKKILDVCGLHRV